MSPKMCSLLLVALLIVPIVSAGRLEPLFNTTYVQRIAERGIDFYNNQTIVWSNGSSSIIAGNMTRLLLSCGDYKYQMHIDTLGPYGMRITVNSRNLTLAEDQEAGFDINNDSKDDVTIVATDIKLGKADISLSNLCVESQPQTLREVLESNKELVVLFVFALIFFWWLFRRGA